MIGFLPTFKHAFQVYRMITNRHHTVLIHLGVIGGEGMFVDKICSSLSWTVSPQNMTQRLINYECSALVLAWFQVAFFSLT